MRIVCRDTDIAWTAVLGVALTASLAAGPRQTTRAAETQAAARAVANGRTSYMKIGCETCHGVDGGGSPTASRIAATALDLQAFIAYVRKPTGTMPAQTTIAASNTDLTDIFAFLHSPAARNSQANAAPPPALVEAGALLYRKNGCYECHVNEGQGGAQGPRLGPNPIPFPRFVAYVRNPAGEMPPFTAKVLTDQDLAAIYGFLQARPVPPPVSAIPLLVP